MRNWSKNYPLAFVLIASAVLLFAHLGLLQTNIMEARNLISAREMAQSGDWIFTTLNGQARYEKPPLPTWLTAISGSIFGFGDLFWLRFPVALATLLLVYFFYRTAKILKLEIEQSVVAALILITSFYVFFSGRDNQWDMYCHAFMAGSVFFLVRGFRQIGKTNLWLAGFFFGLSFLSKGPVSVYALFLPFAISYFVVFKGFRSKWKWLALTVFIGLLIGLSWPVYVRFADPLHGSQTAAREAGRWAGYNTRPFWYYWSFFTQSGIWTIPAFVALLYPYMIKRVENVQAYRFSFWWTILSVVLLSLIPEKKARYLLPVLIPMALNTSFYIRYLILHFRNFTNRYEKAVVYFAFGLTGVIALAVPVVLILVAKENLSEFGLWIALSSVVSVGCGILIFTGLRRKTFPHIFFGTILLMCGLVAFGLPVSKAYYLNPDHFGANQIRKLEQEYNIKSYEASAFAPEIVWDYGKKLPLADVRNPKNFPKEARFGLLLNPKDSLVLIGMKQRHTIQKLARIDLNDIPKKRKGYNERLVRDYFLVEKQAVTLASPQAEMR